MNHEPVKNDQRNAQKPKGSLAYPRPSPESVPGKCDKIHRRQMILLPGPESSQVTEINHFQFGSIIVKELKKLCLVNIHLMFSFLSEIQHLHSSNVFPISLLFCSISKLHRNSSLFRGKHGRGKLK